MFNRKSSSRQAAWFGFVVSLCLLQGALVWNSYAKTDAEIEATIQSFLSQRHPKDSLDDWRALGPNTPRIIIAMYSKAENIYHRIRLVEGLRAFGNDPQAVEFLKQLAGNTDEASIKKAAIRSVGVAEGEKGIEFVSKYLKDSDAQTRLAAAQTLQAIDTERASALLDQYMKDEKAEWIVSRLKKEAVKPSRPLTLTASSEDRVHPAFQGAWKGLWIAPKEGPKGLVSEPSQLRLTVEGATGIRSPFSQLNQNYSISKMQGKGTKISGSLVRGPLRQPKSASVAFEGELVEQAGSQILRIYVPAMGATVVMRKEES